MGIQHGRHCPWSRDSSSAVRVVAWLCPLHSVESCGLARRGSGALALQGENVFAMLKGIRGEGNPAVWYLLLRGAHALVARPEVLQIVALIVASAAILLLVLRSPFSLPLIALILVGPFAIFEYSVMARNYGISMLLLFLLATLRAASRSRVPDRCSALSAGQLQRAFRAARRCVPTLLAGGYSQ